MRGFVSSVPTFFYCTCVRPIPPQNQITQPKTLCTMKMNALIINHNIFLKGKEEKETNECSLE